MGNLSKKTLQVRNIIAFNALIIILFSIMVIYEAVHEFRIAEKEGELNASRLSGILTEHVAMSLNATRVSLDRLADQLYYNEVFQVDPTSLTIKTIDTVLEENAHLSAILIADFQGNVVYVRGAQGQDNWVNTNVSLSGEDLFLTLRQASNDQVYLGRNFGASAQDQKQFILLGKRITDFDGYFKGVAVAAISPEYFTKFFSSIEFSDVLAAEKIPSRFMSIIMSDGSILASGPSDKVFLENAMVKGFENLGAQFRQNNAVIKRQSFADSISITSFKGLDSFPITIGVMLDEDEFLSTWWQNRLLDAGILFIFLAFGVVVSLLIREMAVQVKRSKQSEKAAVLASQAKSEFLANMSHELRTPLNAIIGFSEMMQGGYFGKLNDKQNERITDINLCGSHLLQLINDVLDFSKGDAGKLSLDDEEMNMAEIIDESVRIISEKANGKNIDLIKRVDASLPAMLGDKRKLRQVILNLMSNAVKFTPDGGQVKLTSKINHKGDLEVIVSDTGVGIAEEDIEKAMSVFGQVNREKHAHEGTGLGLPLSKMLVELHDGRMILESVLGEGTSVKVIIPAKRVLTSEDKILKLDQTSMAEETQEKSDDAHESSETKEKKKELAEKVVEF